MSANLKDLVERWVALHIKSPRGLMETFQNHQYAGQPNVYNILVIIVFTIILIRYKARFMIDFWLRRRKFIFRFTVYIPYSKLM